MSDIYPPDEAIRRIRTDLDALLDRTGDGSDPGLREPHELYAGPLGHFCDSLHDLVGHILMWTEIDLQVLHEARSGRRHWSIEPQWETPEIGAALNCGGVSAARELPTVLLVDRLRLIRDALTDEIAAVPATEWDTIGPTVQYAMSPPGAPAYTHARRHLDPQVTNG